MKFLFCVINSRTAPQLAPPEEMQAIDTFNNALATNNHLVMAAGICHPDEAMVFDHRSSAGTSTAGSIITGDDYMAGFWVIEAPSVDEAHQLAAQASAACNRRIEVRKFL